jgi:hypothetical protein
MRNWRGCGFALRFRTIGRLARDLRSNVKLPRSIPSAPCAALALAALLCLPATLLARELRLSPELEAARLQAEQGLSSARAVEAGHHAPVELGAAEAALASALAAAERRRSAEAAILFRRAGLQASLARSRAEAARARDVVRRREAEIDALRAELLPEEQR